MFAASWEWQPEILLSTGDIVSAAGFVTALVTVLTLTFFLILGKERYINAG